MIDTVAIVGVGLIGGSVGRALRERNLARRVIGLGRSESRLQEAVRLGALHEGTTDESHALGQADVVVVATPVDRLAHDVKTAARVTRPTTLITDAGSTKHRLIEAIERDPEARLRFVGAHPIAGSERSGAAHARADLFVGRTCVLTPTASTPPNHLERARSFWSSLGAQIVELSPEEHDRRLAFTSHLPHIVASALASAIPVEAAGLTGGAYRDTTRVAHADTDLWTAIVMENREALIEAIADYERQFTQLADAVRRGDPEAFRIAWNHGRTARSAMRLDDIQSSHDSVSE